ncbi:SPARC-related modular calcium-binding protein 1-like [Gadus macrocephalus]|uniref:SPARC-related modular calcium-binding protein 1-like n=1 Tax=Gadus macrocephalus TaxID=80720 RepID=UPI0028CB2A41|nr:SPARC-related modular calcium-binding protein 1-like [Gadus macrocephalus]XP_059931228.1 SPARC-related modular calcium-binding protein 1-like [Gadus macrocephalus]
MMLALTFTCRLLLLLLLSEPVHSNRSAPFLITENMWTGGCLLDCQRGRHRAVCGTNGRLYKSQCSFQRAQCFNTQLRPAPRSHCTDPSQTKCQLARVQALEASFHSSGGGHTSPSAAIFVPECGAEGHFLPVQCHNQTGYCWCSTRDGRPIGGTSVLLQTPNCTDLMPETEERTGAGSSDRETSGPTGKLGRPGAEPTAPPLWVTIQLNSDPKGNRSTRQPSDSPQTCERERRSLLAAAQVRSVRLDDRFVPECTADGRYHPVQCHVATGYCWCVRLDTGRPIPGTSTRNQLPECTATEETRIDRKFKDKALLGCPVARKKEFLQSLVRALQQEAEHAGKLPPPKPFIPAPTYSSSSSVTPSSTSSIQTTPSTQTNSTSGSPVLESSGPEGALRWHFERLDVDASGALSEREARPLRQFLRRRLKPRRCAKKFAQYCDRDQDRSLTLGELSACIHL